MPLHILLSLVVFGIAGIALLLHLLGLTTRLRLDAERARAAWLREFPEAPVTSITLCEDGSAALLQTAQGPGVVWPMGADTTARLLSGARITASDTGLTVRMADVTAPRLTLRLDAAEARRWVHHTGHIA